MRQEREDHAVEVQHGTTAYWSGQAAGMGAGHFHSILDAAGDEHVLFNGLALRVAQASGPSATPHKSLPQVGHDVTGTGDP